MIKSGLLATKRKHFLDIISKRLDKISCENFGLQNYFIH